MSKLVTKVSWKVEGLDDLETCKALMATLRNLRGVEVARAQPGLVEVEVLGSDEPPTATFHIKDLGGRVLDKHKERIRIEPPAAHVFPDEQPEGTKTNL